MPCECPPGSAPAAHLLPALLPARWNSTLQTLVASFEAYEDLMKKSQEGKDFYADLESKVAALLERTQSICQTREAARQQLLDRWVWLRGLGAATAPTQAGLRGLALLLPRWSHRELKKKPPPRPTAPKPLLARREECEVEPGDPPEELRSLPPDAFLGAAATLPFPAGAFPHSAGPGPR